MLNLSVLLEDSAFRHKDKPAFTFGDNTLSFAQVNGAANQVANGLKAKGIKPGDKVALNCLNLPYFPIIYFGILKAGAVCVPLSVLLKKDETSYHLKDSEAKAWKTLWSAGQGVTNIHDNPTVAELVDKMKSEFKEAILEQNDLLKIYN